MSLSQQQMVFTNNIGKLISFAESKCIGLTFGDAYRTAEQQRIYVNQGKSRTMNSKHRKRLAVDFNFFIDGNLTYDFEDVKILGDYWESLNPNNRWGGDWNNNEIADGFLDTPHFEMNL